MFSKAFEGLASSMVFVPTEKRSIVSVFNFFNSHISLLHTLSTGKKKWCLMVSRYGNILHVCNYFISTRLTRQISEDRLYIMTIQIVILAAKLSRDLLKYCSYSVLNHAKFFTCLEFWSKRSFVNFVAVVFIKDFKIRKTHDVIVFSCKLHGFSKSQNAKINKQLWNSSLHCAHLTIWQN